MLAGLYGPAEVRGSRESPEKATLEVLLRTKVWLPGGGRLGGGGGLGREMGSGPGSEGRGGGRGGGVRECSEGSGGAHRAPEERGGNGGSPEGGL